MLNRVQNVFACLNSHEVRYLVIGGVAAVLYGVPRATFDLDVLIEATEENAARLLTAFLEAGLATAEMTTPSDLLAHEITIFKDRVRIDVQTKTPGIDFKQAWERRETMHYQGEAFFVVSKKDLVQAKRAAGRPQDLQDVHMLEMEE